MFSARKYFETFLKSHKKSILCYMIAQKVAQILPKFHW